MPRTASLNGWIFTEDQVRSALHGGPMLNPSIDLGNPCNLNCPYCFIEEKNSLRKRRKPGELTPEESLEVIDDFLVAGARSINIVGAGEPTIDPAFRDVVRRIDDGGATAVIFTNGAQIARRRELAEFLYKHHATVVLKFNALSPAVQDLLVGKRGYTRLRDQALKNLLLVGFAEEAPTRLAFDTVAVQGNLRDLPLIHGLARRNNIFPIISDFIPTGRTEGGVFVGEGSLHGLNEIDRRKVHKLLEPLAHSQREHLVSSLREIDEKNFGILPETGNSAYYSGQPCTQIIGLYVDILGRIWPCVARSRVVRGELTNGLLGNIRNGDKASQIWLDDPYMEMLRQNYTGGCPYKTESRASHTQGVMSFSHGSGLVQIGP